MDYPYLERPVTDEDDISVEVEIDEVGVRMECLKLACGYPHIEVLDLAAAFAEFVINGTVPSKPN